MKRPTISIGSGFKLDGNKVVPDHAARLAKLPLNKQIAARKSKRVKVVRMGRAK